MTILMMFLSLTAGVQSSQPIMLGCSMSEYVDIEIGFEIAEIVFIKGNVITHMFLADQYGFAPFQSDYTIAMGINIEWFELGFIHTCSHENISSKSGYIKVWTGEKIYIKISGEITLIGNE